MIRAEGRRMALRDDWTGTVERVNTGLLHLLIGGGYFPVLDAARRIDARRGHQCGWRSRRGDGGAVRWPRRRW